MTGYHGTSYGIQPTNANSMNWACLKHYDDDDEDDDADGKKLNFMNFLHVQSKPYVFLYPCAGALMAI
jgi:hypothetical protein